MYFDKNFKTIQNNNLFKNVLSNEISLNIRTNNFIEIDDGGIIYQAGENSNSIYLVIRGHVKLKIYKSSGGSIFLERFENEFFGEKELLEKTTRKSSAMAMKKTLLYVINQIELNELIGNKTALANLFKPTSARPELSQNPAAEQQTSLIMSDEKNDDETLQEMNPSNSTELENANENEEDLGWNNSNIDECKDVLDNEETIDFAETEDEHTAKFDYVDDEENSTNTEDQSMSITPINNMDETESLFDTGKTLYSFENSNDSILDQIKDDLKENSESLIDKSQSEIEDSEQGVDSSLSIPEENIVDENEAMLTENISVDSSSEEINAETPEPTRTPPSLESYQELIKKLTRSISDELRTPVELIKKYANLLMRNSSSAEANRILHKVLDQTNVIASTIQAQDDWFNQKINLETHIYYAEKILTEILQLLAGYTEFRNVKLFKKFEADASVSLDKSLFYQACLQTIKILCENIISDGKIFVTIKRTNELLIVEFKSNGPDFSDELLRYFNEQIMIKENPGLNFAKKIIREHDGALSAQNIINGGPEIKMIIPIVK